MSDAPLTLMAVHAHPDDEVFSTGGILAEYSAQGLQTVLVTCTYGEMGEIVDPELETPENFARLKEIRIEELKESVAALGITHQEFLGYRDSDMMGRDGNKDPRAFHNAVFYEAVGKLVALIRKYRPQVMVTYDEFGGYGHPDHVQAHNVAVVAYAAAGDERLYPEEGVAAWQPQKLYYASFLRAFFAVISAEMKARGIDSGWNNPDLDNLSVDAIIEKFRAQTQRITTRVDVRDHLDQKRAALRAHRTQIKPDNFFFTLPDDIARKGLGYEYFALADSRLDGIPAWYAGRTDGSLNLETFTVNGDLETDLFNGLR